MQRALTVPSIDIEARAWRLHFQTRPPGAGSSLANADVLTVREPRQVHVVAEPVDASVPPLTTTDSGGSSLALLWMPPLANEDADAAWLEGIPLEGSRNGARVVRAGLRTARVVWTDQVAVIYATHDQFEDARDAVIRFTVLERDTCEIEAGMPAVWASIHRNVRLTHTVRSSDLRRDGNEVGLMTEQVTEMNSRALHNDAALEQLDTTLKAGSKRLFAELALQADLYDRLEGLGEPLDFAFEYHETLNTRIIDAAQWSLNNRLEMSILLVLTLEFGVTIYPYLAHFIAAN